VLAVADATVIGVVQRFPDQPIGKLSGNLDYPGANTITLDLGSGVFAFYAHLKPGSLKVHEGEKVRRGQELALLGNSGNSTAPHLHFHVADGPAGLGANGTPYVFDVFSLEGSFTHPKGPGGQPLGERIFKQSAAHDEHKNELPEEGAVVSFP
jgi:murein DD-endopeptidase MepM/ murein hydrolase activator NlpD